jgi:hypothetical protein
MGANPATLVVLLREFGRLSVTNWHKEIYPLNLAALLVLSALPSKETCHLKTE